MNTENHQGGAGYSCCYGVKENAQFPVIPYCNATCMVKNIVAVMSECSVKRLVFMGAVGIYNEIPVWGNAKSEQEGRAAAPGPGLKLFA